MTTYVYIKRQPQANMTQTWDEARPSTGPYVIPKTQAGIAVDVK